MVIGLLNAPVCLAASARAEPSRKRLQILRKPSKRTSVPLRKTACRFQRSGSKRWSSQYDQQSAPDFGA
ncbi:hypothetical protein GBAR_LOCUS30604 [Geodia barretti]|uniref:Uncharacterized protein n=1 Tax=Geodia barretti TaxID=519541 RepID=A0AA35TYL5_GEOBA|nr:hypothetical protein GBAR_LOCUS30604 [Geodia barretti]